MQVEEVKEIEYVKGSKEGVQVEEVKEMDEVE